MSQVSIIDIETNNPQIPTTFVTNSGNAIPIANTLEVLGINGITTSGSGNTITIDGDGLVTDVTLHTDVGGPLVGDDFSLTGTNIYTTGSGTTASFNLQGTNHALVVGRGANTPAVSLAAATNGQLPIGSTGADPVLSTLTGGTGITIANGAGSITVNASATTPLSFPTDSGTATPAANALNVVGQSGSVSASTGGIQTLGSGANLTVRMLSPYTLGDFLFNNTTLATKRTVEVRNSAADASSDSVIVVKTAGSNTSDAYYQVGQGSTNIYCFGNDQSDSNTLKICQDPNANTATPSGGTLLWKMTIAGAASYVAGNLDVTRSPGGVPVSITASNTGNASGIDNALFQSTTGGATGGDPLTTYTVTGVTSWSTGIDNSVTGDPYVISASTSLGTSDAVSILTNGTITFKAGQVVALTTPGAYPYTTLATDFVILVDSASARTITPLGSPVTGQMYRIKDNVGSAGTNNITITPSGKNIDNAASATINVNFGSMDIVYNGTQWNVL